MHAYYFQITPNTASMKGGAALCSEICACGGFCISTTCRGKKLKTLAGLQQKPFAVFRGLKNYRSVVIL